MKKIFDTIGIIALTLFSFYYTDKIIEISEKKDTIMVSINEYAQKNERECIEGKITENGIILGISGIKINKQKSYSNMKGIGFNEEEIAYNKERCIVNKEKNIDRYIIGGNYYKKAVSIMIKVDNIFYLKDILDIAQSRKIGLSLIVDLNTLKTQKKLLKEYFEKGIDILYSDVDNIESFLSELKEITDSTYCVYIDNDLIDDCKTKKINSIKTNKIFNNNIFSKVTANLEIGDLIVLNSNKETKDNLGLIVNFIESKGIKVLTITDHLS